MGRRDTLRNNFHVSYACTQYHEIRLWDGEYGIGT